MADLDATMRALRFRTRREILARIWDRDLSAGEIAAAFDLTPATISEHLGFLRRAGLVDMTKVGTSRQYRAKPGALAGLHGARSRMRASGFRQMIFPSRRSPRRRLRRSWSRRWTCPLRLKLPSPP
jgi:DNA-binding transcriptional ArsR family regulator